MKTFTKIMKALCFVILSLAISKACGAAETEQTGKQEPDRQTLVFLNWSEYTDPDIVKAFEAKFNVTVKEVFFETDEMRDEKLAFTMGKGYDLAMMAGISMARYVRSKWITQLDFSEIPNIRHIAPRWRNAFPYAEKYAVPYVWGTLGIAYRKDKVPGKITTWKQLFRPAESLRGKIMMIKYSNDTIGMALKALGYSINSTDMEELAQAEKLLLSQKPFVNKYSYLMLSKTSGLITGVYHMAMLYNGDALALQNHDENIAFVVPEEGTNLWVDYLTVMESSDKKELAHAFINFLNEPKNAAKTASFLYYATPNQSAEKHLPAEHLNNPIIYPDEGVLSRSEFYRKLPARIRKKRNSIFSKLLR